MAMTDDLQRVVRELWRVNMLLGWPQRTGYDPGTMGRLAKASGATESQVQSWMAGLAQPTVSQSLAVLDALPLPRVGVAELNGSAK